MIKRKSDLIGSDDGTKRRKDNNWKSSIVQTLTFKRCKSRITCIRKSYIKLTQERNQLIWRMASESFSTYKSIVLFVYRRLLTLLLTLQRKRPLQVLWWLLQVCMKSSQPQINFICWGDYLCYRWLKSQQPNISMNSTSSQTQLSSVGIDFDNDWSATIVSSSSKNKKVKIWWCSWYGS